MTWLILTLLTSITFSAMEAITTLISPAKSHEAFICGSVHLIQDKITAIWPSSHIMQILSRPCDAGTFLNIAIGMILSKPICTSSLSQSFFEDHMQDLSRISIFRCQSISCVYQCMYPVLLFILHFVYIQDKSCNFKFCVYWFFLLFGLPD